MAGGVVAGSVMVGGVVVGGFVVSEVVVGGVWAARSGWAGWRTVFLRAGCVGTTTFRVVFVDTPELRNAALEGTRRLGMTELVRPSRRDRRVLGATRLGPRAVPRARPGRRVGGKGSTTRGRPCIGGRRGTSSRHRPVAALSPVRHRRGTARAPQPITAAHSRDVVRLSGGAEAVAPLTRLPMSIF